MLPMCHGGESSMYHQTFTKHGTTGVYSTMFNNSLHTAFIIAFLISHPWVNSRSKILFSVLLSLSLVLVLLLALPTVDLRGHPIKKKKKALHTYTNLRANFSTRLSYMLKPQHKQYPLTFLLITLPSLTSHRPVALSSSCDRQKLPVRQEIQLTTQLSTLSLCSIKSKMLKKNSQNIIS